MESVDRPRMGCSVSRWHEAEVNPSLSRHGTTEGNTEHGQAKFLHELLKEQPAASIQTSPAAIEATVKDRAGNIAVEITNGARFARLVRLRLEWEGSARQPHVVMCDDNYFDLFPGEKKRVPMEFRTPRTFGGTVAGTLFVEGTNVPEIRVPIRLVESK